MKTFLALFLFQAFALSSLALADDVRFDEYSLLTQSERASFTVQSLSSLNQAELDLLYSRLDSGKLPQGEYKGTVVFDGSESNEMERMLAIISPNSFLENILKTAGVSIWGGKIFDNASHSLTNRVGIFKRYPAHVFCGQSLLDSRRESIVLDYAYADSLPNYVPIVDFSMTRFGLSIRDEIRMVRPGLYLGRAYIRGSFALNFILEGKEVDTGDASWANTCAAE